MKKIFILFTLSIFLLVGCQNDGNDTGGSSTNPFLSGTTGFRIDFAPGAPPDEVFDGGDFKFDVEVKIENAGEHDVNAEDIIVKLDGISPNEFGKTQSEFVMNGINENLRGAEKDSASGNRIEGDVSYVTFEDLNYEGEIVGASLTRPILATVCYEYATKATSSICILDDLTDDDSEVCTVDQTKKSYSSSAPVGVTSFLERQAGKDKVEFQFVIENQASTANIYREGSGCSDERNDEDVVFVSVESGISGLNCAGLQNGDATSGYVTLRDRKYTIRCTQEVDTQSDYETSVNIDLSYGVEESVRTTIRIEDSQ